MEDMSDPIPAVRSAPGEFFLAAETVEVGLRFLLHDALYEVVSEPRKWGVAWVAQVRVIEGLRPGIQLQAMLHTGKKMESE